MESKPLVSILILSWNRLSETIRAIKSASVQSYKNIEIIVVDNGSTELFMHETLLQIEEVKYIKLGKNYGCPGGRNRGIHYCNGEFILFCDNDGILHENALENAMNCILKDDKIAIVAGNVIPFYAENEIDTKLETTNRQAYETNLFSGTISLHRKSIFNNVGYYPDDYMYGGEETYLSLKILDAGYTIMKSDDVILWHKRSSLARDDSKNIIQAWRNTYLNAFQLFPIEYFLLFALYFYLVYPFYAIKYGVFKHLRFLIYLPFEIFEYKRSPVTRKTFWKFRKLGSKKNGPKQIHT